MPADSVDYRNSGYFSKLIIDYLDQKEPLRACYNRFFDIDDFAAQIDEKSNNFDLEKRGILEQSLKQQYKNSIVSKKTNDNISLLKKQSTFTVTTGHQLNIFTGPLYFFYKIISTINLCKALKTQYPIFDFVPVYWMATEDHDFDEICFFNLNQKKIKWNKSARGPVGRLDTDGLDQVFEVFSKEIGHGENANRLRALFQNAYLKYNNLASATKFLVNEIFGEYGLVIIDGDDKILKKEFSSIIRSELTNKISFKLVSETIETLKDYKVQVNPREINLFYIEKNVRERILFENEKYFVNNTTLSFSEQEILSLVDANPEKFSPNVILRPLYQEVILPNLCYIGGGGELAYWFELKAVFENYRTTFPILLLRNSVLIVSEKQSKKADQLQLTWAQLFLKQTELLNEKTKELSEIKIDFSQQKQILRQQFEFLSELAQKTDKSFLGAVLAQQKKQINGLEVLEKRLLKAQKRKFSELLHQIISLQNELFPNQSLQERQANFSQFFDDNFIEKLIENLNPLETEFKIIVV